jgi:hypothetical protein
MTVVGTFNQNGGTATINGISTAGVFSKSAGQFTANALGTSGEFIHAGGTLSIASMGNSGTAVIGGIQAWPTNATFTNAGLATFTTNAGSIARNLGIVASDGTIAFDSSQSLRSLSFAGGRARISSGAGVVGTDVLTITANTANAFDLADGTWVWNYTGLNPPGSDVRGWLLGTQIYSSLNDAQHRVGYAEATQLYAALPTTLGGEPIDATTLITRLTLAGDANLDGVVDAVDLGNLALHWTTSDAYWFDGDFTYDGRVDVADLKLLAQNFEVAFGSPSLETLLVSFGLPVDAVPEPSVVLGPIGVALLGRRRRRVGRKMRNCSHSRQ